MMTMAVGNCMDLRLKRITDGEGLNNSTNLSFGIVGAVQKTPCAPADPAPPKNLGTSN